MPRVSRLRHERRAEFWRSSRAVNAAGSEFESRRCRPALFLASHAVPALARGVGRRNSRSLACLLHGAARWRPMRPATLSSQREPPRASPRASQTSLTPESRRRRLIGAGAASTTQDLVQSTSVGTKYSGHPHSLKKFYLLALCGCGVDFCYRKARQGLARSAVAAQRERPYAALGGWLSRATGTERRTAAARSRDAGAASRSEDRDRSCGPARCPSDRRAHRSDSASR